MPKYFSLKISEQKEALNVAADACSIAPHILEKDIWVVWTLQQLFNSTFAQHLVFKGGTSLSKAFGVIQRFSEDIDLTYDIRAIAADLIGESNSVLPRTNSQEKKWSKAIRDRLSTWVETEIVPLFKAALQAQNLQAKVRWESGKVFIEYHPLFAGTGYVSAAVMMEFGARSTGEPVQNCLINCDAAEHLNGLLFPSETVRVMRAERTFWEKATAIHVYCIQGAFRGGDRYARHWHDLSRLDAAGIANAAIADRNLAKAVAAHKAIFFSEKNMTGEAISYQHAISGQLQLVPRSDALANLSADYANMIDDGLFLHEVETFDVLMENCQRIQDKVNGNIQE
jgi:Nucleotidyl transferase AbiEii toxin, Type IV TA system